MPRSARPRFHPGNKRWCAQVGEKGPNGKSSVVYFPATIGEHDEAGAWAYLREYLVSRARPQPIESDPPMMVLGKLYVDWAEAEVRAGRMDVKSWQNKRTHVKRLMQYGAAPGGRALPGRPASSIDAGDMDGFVRHLKAKYSAHYAKNVVRSIVAMLNWAARPVADRDPPRILPESPLRGWKSNVTTRKVTRYADHRVVKAFRRWAWSRARWNWINPAKAARYRERGWKKPTPAIRRSTAYRFDRIFLLMTRFIAITGCRPKEACMARWSDLKWDDSARMGGTLKLDKWKNDQKTGQQRTIFVTRQVARILRALEGMDGRHPEWIFTHRIGPKSPMYSVPGPHRVAGEPWQNGTTLGAKLRSFRASAVEAGVRSKDGKPIGTTGPNRLVNYLFRHTYISDALARGVSISQIAKITGTSAEVIERTYGHQIESEARKLAEELAENRHRRKP
jgi:integrase